MVIVINRNGSLMDCHGIFEDKYGKFSVLSGSQWQHSAIGDDHSEYPFHLTGNEEFDEVSEDWWTEVVLNDGWTVDPSPLCKFITLGNHRGFIGLPCQGFFDDLTDLPAKIEFAGPIGDVEMRLYWEDVDHRGDLCGGCISIPTMDLLSR